MVKRAILKEKSMIESGFTIVEENKKTDVRLVPCVECGKEGYTDERVKTDRGYICTRCANPHIDWDNKSTKE